MYTWKQTAELVGMELDMQAKMAETYSLNKVLNVPCVIGPVGCGKTSMFMEQADNRGMDYVAINCGDLSDPADLGIGFPDDGRTMIKWLLNESLLRATKDNTFLLFDDVDKAPPHIQGALLSIAGAREVRDLSLHPGTLVALAGNRLGDDILANTISESLKTRATIIEMEPDLASFIEFGKRPTLEGTEEIHPAIRGYVEYAPKHLFHHDPEKNRFPTPRGWWEASRHLDQYDVDRLLFGRIPIWKNIVDRKLGEGVGSDFWAWYAIVREVDPAALLAGTKSPPDGTTIESYAMMFAVTSYLRKTKITAKMEKGLTAIVASLDASLRVAFMRQLSKKSERAIAIKFPEIGNLLTAWVSGKPKSK